MQADLREAIARVIDPEAWEEYLLEDGRVDEEVASIFQDAYETSLAKASDIIALIEAQNTTPGSGEGWRLVPVEPTEAMLKAAFVAMNETPSGTWKRMKAEGQTPRRMFDVKMAPRYRAMLAAAPLPPPPGEGGTS